MGSVHFVEAVDEGNGSLLGDFGLDVFAEWGGPGKTQVLPFVSAVLVGLDGGN